MATKTTGLKSIAYSLGISVNTVSRALRDCDDISAKTKEKVRQKAFELGYLPNNVSQFIKRDGRQLIAIVLNSFRNNFFSIMCEKLINNAKERDFDFCILYTFSRETELDTIKQCISQRVDIIVSLLEPTDEAIQSCLLNEIPFIMVGRKINYDSIDCVYIDDDEGGKLAANYLINFHKLKKFIYIKMNDIECSKRREKSFISTIEQQLGKDGDVVVLDEKFSKRKLIELINEGYYGTFCFNDELAYDVLNELNKDIPNFRKVYPRFHLVGFDCLNTRRDGLIDITSIDFDYDMVCSKVFECIDSRLEDKKRTKVMIKLPVSLHQRIYT